MVAGSGKYVRPEVAIGQSLSAEGLSVTSHFYSLYGGTRFTSFSPVQRNPENRPVCRWAVTGAAVFSALSDLDRSMIIKQPQARLLLAHQHLFPGNPNRGFPLSEEMSKERHLLKSSLKTVRAQAQTRIRDEYSAQLLNNSPSDEEQFAYGAGFCDADAYFGCIPTGGKFRYEVHIVQKNCAFLQAFKHVILRGKGSNVSTRRDGISCLHIRAERDVQDFCARIRAFSIVKAKQLDVIMSEPPSASAREALCRMHGRQGKKIHGSVRESRGRD